MDPIIIHVRPAPNRPGHSEARLGDATGELLCVSRQPLLDSARVLQGRGIDPTAQIVMRREGSETDLLTATVGAAAKLTVREDDRVSPTFRRWKAFSRSAIKPPIE